MQLDVLNIEGKKTGRTVELPEEIFGIEPNDHVIYLAVKQFQGAQRQGSHKVKTRAEVKGSSKKLHKQKDILRIRLIYSEKWQYLTLRIRRPVHHQSPPL